MDVKEDSILGEDLGRHWYYVSKGRAMLDVLGDVRADEVLDVGAGSGVFSRLLLDEHRCVRATCVDPAYSDAALADTHDPRMVRRRELAEPTQPLVLMMDVLEHVDDDVALLMHYTRHLPPHGRVLVSVPAFQALWSGHDDFLEHRRRYTRSSLERVVRAAGLDVLRTRYFYGLLLPLAAATRWWDRLRLAGGAPARSALRRQGTVTNAALVWIHEIERRLLLPVNGLAGLSIFCLAGPPQTTVATRGARARR
jgi:SAM-dependent methyltransferase